jgi:hypothetical protein
LIAGPESPPVTLPRIGLRRRHVFEEKLYFQPSISLKENNALCLKIMFRYGDREQGNMGEGSEEKPGG